MHRLLAQADVEGIESLTRSSDSPRVNRGMAKRLFLVMAAVALLFLQFGDCMSAMTMDQQSMQCCASMPCTPANHSRGCCKNMTSAHAPSMLPAQHASLHGPIVAAIEYPRTLDMTRPVPVPLVKVDAAQHSPPELYTLHVSLLI